MTVTARCFRIIFSILIVGNRLNKHSTDATTSTNEFESQFLINVNDGEDHYCVGSYVSPGWVLSTAVCAALVFEDVAYIRLSAGDEEVETPQAFRKARTVVLRDDYTLNRKINNIGLIRLTNPFEYSSRNRFVRLHLESRSETEECFIFGWFEQAIHSGTHPSNRVRKSRWKFFEIDECEKRLNKTGDDTQQFIEEQMECGRDEHCISDDGAPLLCEGKLYGLLSTADCAVSVVVKVSFFSKWIHKKTNYGLIARSTANSMWKSLNNDNLSCFVLVIKVCLFLISISYSCSITA